MLYESTRGGASAPRATRAVLDGIAADGGLYMPQSMDGFDWEAVLQLPTLAMAERILSHLLPDFADMGGIVRRAYTGKFETEELTPLLAVGDRYVLELFRGPTSAFKDVALSVLPQLIAAAREQEQLDDEIVILTATSGDTGKAALEGFHDVAGTKIVVFYPADGVSTVQRAQMVTQCGDNVHVCAVRGNFDDAQSGVKDIFAAAGRSEILPGVRLSSANSINIGRLAPQLVYYFKAYADLLRMGRIQKGELVDFTVPTGNFGDILAGYFAKLLGLPVGRLICASNANNVLTDFIRTGCYNRMRPFHKTLSPSMDILISSNLERLLYLLTERDTAQVAQWMQMLRETGMYTVTDAVMEKIQAQFYAESADDARTTQTIGEVFRDYGYLCDPHTAVAWDVATRYMREHGTERPNVVLSTASPYKFPTAVVRALGAEPLADEFSVMEQLHTLSGVAIPRGLAQLRGAQERHSSVIARAEMVDFIEKAVRG